VNLCIDLFLRLELDSNKLSKVVTKSWVRGLVERMWKKSLKWPTHGLFYLVSPFRIVVSYINWTYYVRFSVLLSVLCCRQLIMNLIVFSLCLTALVHLAFSWLALPSCFTLSCLCRVASHNAFIVWLCSAGSPSLVVFYRKSFSSCVSHNAFVTS